MKRPLAYRPGIVNDPVVIREDANTLRIDFSPDAVCWCYKTPRGTRYASAGADAYLLPLYVEADGVVQAANKTPDGKRVNVPNLLPAIKRLFARSKQSVSDGIKSEL